MWRRRKLWIILLAAPLALLAADTLCWRIAVRSLEAGFTAWSDERRATGWSEAYGTPVRGGWPLAATLTVPAISLAGANGDIPGGLAWSADSLVLRVALPRPSLLRIAAKGTQRLRLAASPEVSFTADRMDIELPLQPARRPPFLDVIVERLRANTPVGDDASVDSVRLHLDIRPEAQSGDPALAFAVRATAMTLPSGMAQPLGPHIASLAVDGALNGPIPLGHTPVERAAAWRDGGGSLEIRHLALVWGPLDLTGSATLALDGQLQPMGSASARVVGYAETLDSLAAHAAISRSAATAAKAVLSLLANSPGDGRPPDVEVPLTLQYRTLSMRQVPLVRLPEIEWP
jgi:hypothetical protein